MILDFQAIGRADRSLIPWPVLSFPALITEKSECNIMWAVKAGELERSKGLFWAVLAVALSAWENNDVWWELHVVRKVDIKGSRCLASLLGLSKTERPHPLRLMAWDDLCWEWQRYYLSHVLSIENAGQVFVRAEMKYSWHEQGPRR